MAKRKWHIPFYSLKIASTSIRIACTKIKTKQNCIYLGMREEQGIACWPTLCIVLWARTRRQLALEWSVKLGETGKGDGLESR